jgi:hypothetical protein
MEVVKMPEEKDLEQVADVNAMYGYEDKKKEEEQKKGGAWLKTLLDHLDKKKQYYLRKVD